MWKHVRVVAAPSCTEPGPAPQGRPGRIRRVDGPMIGRQLEQRLLHTVFARTLAESSCHLVTTLGPAGVGTSRLVEEFAKQVGSRATIALSEVR
jgi:hypothetical protein